MKITVLVETDDQTVVGSELDRVLILSKKQHSNLLETLDQDQINYNEVGMDVTVKQLVEHWLKSHKKDYISDSPKKAYLFE